MFKATLVALFLIAPLTGFSDDHAKVENLSWLTGSWDGQLGPNVLEENWSLPRSGSIASLVRQTGPDGMGMVEMVFIEEANGTLELHLQQWDSGFSPRTPSAQKMTMSDMTENSVTFQAVGEGGLAQHRRGLGPVRADLAKGHGGPRLQYLSRESLGRVEA